MIPLHDAQGRVIGFTARLLEDIKDAPKYINTPQTPLYDKSRHVYGLHLAKEGIRKSNYVVLVEGNLDVIASHQAGVRQVVATAGTAMTEYHLKALSRFTDDIRLSFDQDKAGINATERAIPIASKVGVSLSMITIPSGKDPDELIRQDADAWRQVIEKNTYAIDWLIDHYRKVLDVHSVGFNGKNNRQFSDVLLPVVRALSDQVERDHYLKKLADIVGVTQDALTLKYQSSTRSAPAKVIKKPAAAPQRTSKEETTLRRAQNSLLMFALFRPGMRKFLKYLTPEMLVDEPAKWLLTFLQEHDGFTAEDKEGLAVLRPAMDYVKILLVAYEDGQYQDTPDIDLESGAHHQQVVIVGQYVETQQQNITRKYAEADDSAKNDLTEKYHALGQLLAEVKASIA